MLNRFLRTALVALALAAAPVAAVPAHADWSVSDNYAPAFYTASASQTTFSIPWAFEEDDHIRVKTSADSGVTWTLKTLSTHYTVSGEAGTGGSVVFVTGLSAGTQVMIYRDAPVQRTTNFGATISSNSLNYNLNRLTSYVQQVENIDYRQSIKIPATDQNVTVELSTVQGEAGHAPIVNDDEDAVVWSVKDINDLNCLNCPGVTCDGGTNDGGHCASDADCPGGGTCTNPLADCDFISTIGGALTCNTGTCPSGCAGDGGGGGYCAGGTNDGDQCSVDADCPGGTCEPGTGCLQCGPRGTCDGGTNDGASCTIDTDCPEGTCNFTPDGVCYGGTGDGNPCTDDADCAGGGTCRPADDVCVGGANDGLACTTDADCPDGTCVDGGDRCDGGANDGELCQWDSDCPDGFCAACRTCFGGGSADQVCDNDLDCPSGVCMACDEGEFCVGGTGDGDACTDDADCPGGGICSFAPDGVGVLGPSTSTDGAFARWDGITGKFLADSTLNMQGWGVLTGAFGYASRPRGSSLTSESVIFTYPYSATNADAKADAAAWYWFPQKSPLTVEGDASLPVEVQMGWSAASADYVLAGETATTAGMTPTYWSPSTYPVTVFQPGVSTDAQLVARIYFTEPVICPDNWSGSYIKAGTAFTSEKVYNLQKNGSTVGTATFAAAGTTATNATSGTTTSYAAGDYLDIDAPATADATGADLSFSILCYRSITNEVAQ